MLAKIELAFRQSLLHHWPAVHEYDKMRNAHLYQYRASQSIKFKALIYFLTDSDVLVTLSELRLATIASLLSFILNEREKTPLFSSTLPSS